MASARAPPEPPSPTLIATTGTLRPDIFARFEAMAEADAADCKVYEIKASNDEGPSDPEVANGALAKKLKKGPLRAWSKFEKLARSASVQAEAERRLLLADVLGDGRLGSVLHGDVA